MTQYRANGSGWLDSIEEVREHVARTLPKGSDTFIQARESINGVYETWTAGIAEGAQ